MLKGTSKNLITLSLSKHEFVETYFIGRTS
jgi:hypothetical protein